MNEIRSLLTAIIVVLMFLGFSFIVILIKENFDHLEVKLLTVLMFIFLGHITYDTAKKV
jgi:hypothetical protein